MNRIAKSVATSRLRTARIPQKDSKPTAVASSPPRFGGASKLINPSRLASLPGANAQERVAELRGQSAFIPSFGDSSATPDLKKANRPTVNTGKAGAIASPRTGLDKAADAGVGLPNGKQQATELAKLGRGEITRGGRIDQLSDKDDDKKAESKDDSKAESKKTKETDKAKDADKKTADDVKVTEKKEKKKSSTEITITARDDEAGVKVKDKDSGAFGGVSYEKNGKSGVSVNSNGNGWSATVGAGPIQITFGKDDSTPLPEGAQTIEGGSKAEAARRRDEAKNGLVNPNEDQRPLPDPETLMSASRVTPDHGWAINPGSGDDGGDTNGTTPQEIVDDGREIKDPPKPGLGEDGPASGPTQ